MGGHPVHYMMFTSIHSLCPLDDNTPQYGNKKCSRHCQILPGGQNCPSLLRTTILTKLSTAVNFNHLQITQILAITIFWSHLVILMYSINQLLLVSSCMNIWLCVHLQHNLNNQLPIVVNKKVIHTHTQNPHMYIHIKKNRIR